MYDIKLVKLQPNKDFDLFEKLVFNETVMNMDYGKIFTCDEAKKCYKRLTDHNDKSPALGTFKVFDATGIFIGIASLEPNDNLSGAEIEYMLLPEYWNKGYGTELVKKLLDVSKKVPSLKSITAIIDPSNTASKKVLLKNSFIAEKHSITSNGSSIEILTYML